MKGCDLRGVKVAILVLCVVSLAWSAPVAPVAQLALSGKFGEVVIVQPDDARFNTVGGSGVHFGKHALTLTLKNTGDQPLTLIAPPAPWNQVTGNNPFITNTSLAVTGFAIGDRVEPGAEKKGVVTFMPKLRGGQVGTIRFFTDPPTDAYLSGVGGSGVVNASAEVPISVSIGTSKTANIILRNRGDRDLVLAQATCDNAAFVVTEQLPVTVPPEFNGGSNGVPVQIKYVPISAGEQLGKLTLTFQATDIGPVGSATVNVSGGR